MKTHFAIFFTILTLSAGLRAESATPDLDTLMNEKAPTEHPIAVTHEEEGASETYEVSSSTRSEAIYPSNWGTAGIFRIRSAESLPLHALSFGVGGEFYSVNNGPNFGTGTSANTIAESLFIGFSPSEQLTFSMMRRNSSTTFGTPNQLISSLGDFNFSGQYSFPISPSFAIGPVLNFLIASNFNSLSPAVTTLSGGGGIAATYSLYPGTGLPLFLHGNLIYHMPQIRSANATIQAAETYYNFSRYHTLMMGLGAEVKLGDLIPFLELNDTVHTDSPLGFGNSPFKLTVGARFTPLENKSLSLLLGGDIALNRGLLAGAPVPGVPFTPSYQILAQVSYTVGVTQTERKHYFTTQDVNVVDRKFVIKKNIRFKVASAILEPESTSLLNQIAEVVKGNKVKRLLIAGHTDSTHTEGYNLQLSLARANTVKAYLTSRGIPADTFVTQGFGKRKPKASNLTEAGRTLNRRVEFFILE